ncbi:hypothetical protein SK128_019961 [Halocaridina rubra]|uniref:Uncharacterized protein n=1 Tax=Halocaridina rubra TaxID=373956 RepID=A0AAN8X5H9_HALRR
MSDNCDSGGGGGGGGGGGDSGCHSGGGGGGSGFSGGGFDCDTSHYSHRGDVFTMENGRPFHSGTAMHSGVGPDRGTGRTRKQTFLCCAFVILFIWDLRKAVFFKSCLLFIQTTLAQKEDVPAFGDGQLWRKKKTSLLSGLAKTAVADQETASVCAVQMIMV